METLVLEESSEQDCFSLTDEARVDDEGILANQTCHLLIDSELGEKGAKKEEEREEADPS